MGSDSQARQLEIVLFESIHDRSEGDIATYALPKESWLVRSAERIPTDASLSYAASSLERAHRRIAQIGLETGVPDPELELN